MKFLNRFLTNNRHSQRMKVLELIRDMLKSEKDLSMFSKAESDKEVNYFTFNRKIEKKVFNFIISISEHSSEVLREVASIKKRLHKMGLSCKFWWDHNEPKESNGYTRNGFSLKLERI
jgi:hypothetical protein